MHEVPLDDSESVAAQLAKLSKILSTLATTYAPELLEDFMTRRQTATWLKISLSTLDRLVASGMPFVAVGKHRRFERTELVAWLKKEKQQHRGA